MTILDMTKIFDIQLFLKKAFGLSPKLIPDSSILVVIF